MRLIRNYSLLIFMCLVLASCSAPTEGPIGWFDINAPTDEPPGVGEKAERGYAACKPIIDALEIYKEANGGYPTELEELVPRNITAVPNKVNGEDIWYEKTEAGYRLNFTYIGPGMNICTYSPEAGREWKCSGAY